MLTRETITSNAGRNARFWQYINGNLVKLTLRPGQEFNWRKYQRTEEGWTAESHTWSHDEPSGTVFSEEVLDALDCDGRCSSYWKGSFSVTEFPRKAMPCSIAFDDNGIPVEDKTILTPSWERCSASQRDHSAEAAGY